MSTTRDCNSTGGVTRNSNADASFGALTAQGLNADYQLNAWSGLGMVRNYGGQNTDLNFRELLRQRTCRRCTTAATWQVPSTWKPQVVVIGLGINDFSTALDLRRASGRRSDALAADYRTAYLTFIDKLRSRYGPDTYIVLTYPDLSYKTTALRRLDPADRPGPQQPRVTPGCTALYYDNSALGLDMLGCDWHPSQHDDQILAGALSQHLSTLPLTW